MEVGVRWAGPFPFPAVGIEAEEQLPSSEVGEIFRPPKWDGKPFARGVEAASVIISSRTHRRLLSLRPCIDPAGGRGGIEEASRRGSCVASREVGSF